MISVPLLVLACSSIVIATNDEDNMVPTCEKRSPTDIHFDLAKTGLTALKKDFLTGDSVTCIDLSGNTICNMQTSAFDRLPGLLYLNLARNPISFGNFMGMKLPALRGLVLDGPFKDYGLASQKHNPTSAYYNFEYESYDYYNEKDGHRSDDVPTIVLPSLRKLSFRNYQRDAVREWLKHINAPNLTHLDIAGNQLDELALPETMLRSLTHLNMEDNKVHMIIRVLPKIRYLSLGSNKIRNLCSRTCGWYSLSVGGMVTLERLSLAYNKINTIEANAFDKTTNLSSVNLEGNELSSLPENLFKHVKLRNLTLTRNNLTKIPNLCDIVHLEVLGIGENIIASIDESTFCHLQHLRSIDLHGNKLTSVPSGTFARLSALLELDLSKNQLTFLAPNWVGSKERLTSLNLNGNLLSDAEEKAQEKQPHGTVKLEDKSTGPKPNGNLIIDATKKGGEKQPHGMVEQKDKPASPAPNGNLSDDVASKKTVNSSIANNTSSAVTTGAPIKVST